MNNSTTMLPLPLRTMIEAELKSGERITWMGQPMPGRMARSTLPILLFGIPWTLFAVFWMTMAAKGTGLKSFFPWFGLPFVLIGFGMLASPYWASRKAGRTVYVLTDRRAILFSAGWRGSMTVRSFEPDQLKDLRRDQYADGSGNLVFTQDIRANNEGNRVTTNIGFLGIREVKSVEDMVRSLMEKNAKGIP